MTGTAHINPLAVAHILIAATGVELHVRNHMKILLINERIRGRIVLLNGETDHARNLIRSLDSWARLVGSDYPDPAT